MCADDFNSRADFLFRIPNIKIFCYASIKTNTNSKKIISATLLMSQYLDSPLMKCGRRRKIEPVVQSNDKGKSKGTLMRLSTKYLVLFKQENRYD